MVPAAWIASFQAAAASYVNFSEEQDG